MADHIIVVGGSVSGLATALACSAAGRDVTILDRDTVPVPDSIPEAHADWRRPTVPQAAHSHAFGSRGTNLLMERAPEVYSALVDAGALEIDLSERMPPTLSDQTREAGDEELRMLGCRRTSFELVLRRAVLRQPRIELRSGVTVRGLEMAAGSPPRVTGVRTDKGEVISGDAVVDAAGRRSDAEKWLAEAGVPVAEGAASSCDITYYTRYYRALTPEPAGPLNRGFGAGGLWGHYTAVMFLGDNDTFSISVGVLPDDADMKALRTEAGFTAAIESTKLLAPWIEPDVSEPISGVSAMAGIDNSLRGVATTAQEPVAGLFHIGDSAATTNPAYGRGVSLALAHAFLLADVLEEHPTVDVEQSRLMASETERLLSPWFHEAVRNDAGRAGLWRATLAGEQPQAPPPGVLTFGMAAAAAATDPVVWRRLVRVMMTLDEPSTLYDDPEIYQRVGQALQAGPPPEPPPPSREELVEAVTKAAAQQV